MNNSTQTIAKVIYTPVAFGVYYMPNKAGKMHGITKKELVVAFTHEDDAIQYCSTLVDIDQFHVGYRVHPIHFIPRGITVR